MNLSRQSEGWIKSVLEINSSMLPLKLINVVMVADVEKVNNVVM